MKQNKKTESSLNSAINHLSKAQMFMSRIDDTERDTLDALTAIAEALDHACNLRDKLET